MILDIFAYRNKKLKCYTNPFYSQDKIENMETSMGRALMLGGKEMQNKYKNLALYHFGKFDDAAGTYDLLKEPELIYDCDDILAQIPEE